MIFGFFFLFLSKDVSVFQTEEIKKESISREQPEGRGDNIHIFNFVRKTKQASMNATTLIMSNERHSRSEQKNRRRPKFLANVLFFGNEEGIFSRREIHDEIEDEASLQEDCMTKKKKYFPSSKTIVESLTSFGNKLYLILELTTLMSSLPLFRLHSTCRCFLISILDPSSRLKKH